MIQLSLLFALAVQPEEEVVAAPLLSAGEVELIIGLALMIGSVFALDMVRTWWETNRWRREERRRRRAQL
jgi:hypothetical protein